MQNVYIVFKNVYTDKITHLDGSALSVPMTALEFVCSNQLGQYWIQKDTAGVPVLCTCVPMFESTTITVTDAQGNNPYTSEAGIFGGGHPPHRPHVA